MNWIGIKLKVREAQFFADQMRAYTTHPELFLFYLGAFLSSARSVTFHLQKQFAASGKDIYLRLRSELLAGDIAVFLVNLRNYAEKEAYPQLWVQLFVRHDPIGESEAQWTLAASSLLFSDPNNSGLSFLRRIIENEWDHASFARPPLELRYVWMFPNFPGGSRDVLVVCSQFVLRLWEFVARFRAAWEQEHEPDAVNPSLRLLLEMFSEPEDRPRA
jgi:hypothetical protein